MSNSSDWDIMIPDSTSGFFRTAKVDNADLTDITDSIGGQIQSIFYRDIRTGRPLEYYRHRSGSPSTVGISVIESAAKFLIEQRDRDCILALQRKSCHSGVTQHYGRYQANNFTRNRPTAKGLNVRDAVPVVTLSGVFGNYYEFTNAEPQVADALSEIQKTVFSPVDMVYCDCPSCCTGSDGCQTIYALYRVTNTIPDSLALMTSHDGGATWNLSATDIDTQTPTSLHCFNGRLFIGVQSQNPNSLDHEDIFYSDDPESAGSWITVDTSSLYVQFLGLVEVTKFSHSGQTIYCMYVRDNLSTTATWNIARSLDYGDSWEVMHTIVDVNGFRMNDLSSSIRTISAVGDSGKFAFSPDHGVTWDEPPIVASGLSKHSGQLDTAVILDNIYGVGVFNTDFRSPGCTSYIIVDRNIRLFFSDDGLSWRQIWEDCNLYDTNLDSKVEVAADGWIIWIHSQTNRGHSVTLKNIGDYCWLSSISQTVDTELDVLSCFSEAGFVDLILDGDCLDLSPGDIVSIELTDMTIIECEVVSSIGDNLILDNCSLLSPEQICIIGVATVECVSNIRATIFASCPSDPDKAIIARGAANE